MWYTGDVKRRVRTIVLYLVFGALLNIAVAWGIVLMHGYVTFGMDIVRNPRPEEDPMLVRRRLFGHELLVSFGRFPDTWTSEEQNVALATRSAWWPHGTLVRKSQHNFPTVVATGWPCLTVSTWSESGVSEEYSRGFVWEPEFLGYERAVASWDAFVPLIFPIHPLWSGWLLNTPFYAALWWIACGGARSLRATRRRRRGLCVRCRYPRENHVICPECGTTHKARMTGPTAHAPPPA